MIGLYTFDSGLLAAQWDIRGLLVKKTHRPSLTTLDSLMFLVSSQRWCIICTSCSKTTSDYGYEP